MMGGNEETLNVAPDRIFVKPMPSLVILRAERSASSPTSALPEQENISLGVLLLPQPQPQLGRT